MRVRWVKYRSATKLVDTYLARCFELPRGTTRDDLDGVDEMLEGIASQGMWALVLTSKRVPVVHYWHRPGQDPAELAMMLGHELGHVSGTPLKSRRNERREEDRADEYGDVAREVVRRMLDGGQLRRKP